MSKRNYTKLVSVEIEGLQEALDAVKWYDQNANQKLRAVIADGVKAISRGARQRIPVKTGGLKKSIRTRMYTDRGVVGYVRAHKPHAHLVEFGTQGHQTIEKGKRYRIGGNIRTGKPVFVKGAPARPFMVPAYEQEKPRIEAEVAKVLKEVRR
ncbi:MAG: HK97 gp10 family phage protein [Acidaminococcales bacterium]|jgi:HK97 gp10 family phage protein|nr:HK97 gp10 family phage protein [Acidaminococcales bacterium]